MHRLQPKLMYVLGLTQGMCLSSSSVCFTFHKKQIEVAFFKQAEEVHFMSSTKPCKKLFQIEKNKICVQRHGTEGQVSSRALLLSGAKARGRSNLFSHPMKLCLTVET